MSDGKHITDSAADALDDVYDAAGASDERVPGPSPNPATNLMINDIILRSVGRLSRMAVEKAILGRQYGKEVAREAVDNRSMLSALTAYGITKVATRSLPGAALVTTGLVIKTLFDRSQRRREAIKAGTETIRRRAQTGESD